MFKGVIGDAAAGRHGEIYVTYLDSIYIYFLKKNSKQKAYDPVSLHVVIVNPKTCAMMNVGAPYDADDDLQVSWSILSL